MSAGNLVGEGTGEGSHLRSFVHRLSRQQRRDHHRGDATGGGEQAALAPVPLEADGLPAFFLDYLADDEPVVQGEPLRGQQIRRGHSGGTTPRGGAQEPPLMQGSG